MIAPIIIRPIEIKLGKNPGPIDSDVPKSYDPACNLKKIPIIRTNSPDKDCLILNTVYLR